MGHETLVQRLDAPRPLALAEQTASQTLGVAILHSLTNVALPDVLTLPGRRKAV